MTGKSKNAEIYSFRVLSRGGLKIIRLQNTTQTKMHIKGKVSDRFYLISVTSPLSVLSKLTTEQSKTISHDGMS